MKKPLSQCQQCQQALASCRELLARADEGWRTALAQNERVIALGEAQAQELAQTKARLAQAESLLVEAQAALGEGAAVLRSTADTTRQQRRLRDDVELYQRVQSGDVPWLLKDFNVLYRVAQSLLDALPVKHVGESQHAVRRRQDLAAQLERLKPAFTDTEEVRALMRERQGL